MYLSISETVILIHNYLEIYKQENAAIYLVLTHNIVSGIKRLNYGLLSVTLESLNNNLVWAKKWLFLFKDIMDLSSSAWKVPHSNTLHARL